MSLGRKNTKQLKCEIIHGSIVNGMRQPIPFGFVLDKHSAFKVFCEPETTQHEKRKESALKTKPFYFEDNNHNEVNLKGEMSTFTLQLFKT